MEQLQIDTNFKIEWTSNCDQEGACLECPNREHTPTHIAEKPSPSDNNFVAFFDVHKPDPDNPLKCGEIDIGMGMQNFLAYYYAIEQFNAQASLPEEMKVGGMAIDSCGNSIRVIQDVFSMLSGSGPCGASGAITPSSIQGYLAMGSENAIEANKLLAPAGITTISPSATTIELNDAEYFLRTVPPDNVQADAMASILRKQGWYYVAAISSDNSYGRGGISAFIEAANKSSICLATSLTLNYNSDIDDAMEILQQIGEKKGVSVIVLFTSASEARLLLDAAAELENTQNMKGKFIFLASDTWADQEQLVAGVSDYARGSISMKVQSALSVGFMNWVKSLTVANHGDIPDDWFEEFWQYSLRCHLESAIVVQTQFVRPCTSGDRLTDENIEQNAYVLHTIIATQLLASGLQEVKECQNGPCDSLYETIKDSEWNAPVGELEPNVTFSLEFNDKSYGDIGYDIMNYKRPSDRENVYEYVQV